MTASAPPSADPAALVAHAAERRATWLELFFDIVFVAAVAEVAGSLGAHYDWAGLVRFGFLFLLIWWAWIGHTLFATRFDSDDPAQRLLTVGQMFAVAVMAVNTQADLTSREAAASPPPTRRCGPCWRFSISASRDYRDPGVWASGTVPGSGWPRRSG